LESALLPMLSADRSLVLDLSRLEYCGSEGVRLAIRLAKVARARNGTFTIVNPTSIVRRVFAITDVGRVVDILEDTAALPPADATRAMTNEMQ
jgi:anti-anti-sigma factor